VLLERVGGRNWTEAARAGLGALLGFVVGAAGKIACAVAMMALFTVSAVYRTVTGAPLAADPAGAFDVLFRL
jgi:uncharacterized protein YqgC (DUF456 family)